MGKLLQFAELWSLVVETTQTSDIASDVRGIFYTSGQNTNKLVGNVQKHKEKSHYEDKL